MRTSEELRDLAEKVCDTYPDFVRANQDLGYIHGIEQELIDYMKENPDVTTSDILKYEGILTGYTEPLEIIDD